MKSNCPPTSDNNTYAPNKHIASGLYQITKGWKFQNFLMIIQRPDINLGNPFSRIILELGSYVCTKYWSAICRVENHLSLIRSFPTKVLAKTNWPYQRGAPWIPLLQSAWVLRKTNYKGMRSSRFVRKDLLVEGFSCICVLSLRTFSA